MLRSVTQIARESSLPLFATPLPSHKCSNGSTCDGTHHNVPWPALSFGVPKEGECQDPKNEENDHSQTNGYRKQMAGPFHAHTVEVTEDASDDQDGDKRQPPHVKGSRDYSLRNTNTSESRQCEVAELLRRASEQNPHELTQAPVQGGRTVKPGLRHSGSIRTQN